MSSSVSTQGTILPDPDFQVEAFIGYSTFSLFQQARSAKSSLTLHVPYSTEAHGRIMRSFATHSPLVKLTLLASILFFPVSFASAASQAATSVDNRIEEVLLSLESASTSIKSYDVSVTVHSEVLIPRTTPQSQQKSSAVTNPKHPVASDRRPLVFTSRQYYSQGKFRTDLLQNRDTTYAPGEASSLSHNGVSTSYSASRRGATIRPYPANDGELPHRVSYCNLFRNLNSDVTYVQLIKSRPRASIKLTNQDDFLVLDAPPQTVNQSKVNDDLGLKLYLDISRGLQPARIELYFHGKNKRGTWVAYENDLSEITPGLWLPKRSVKRVYNIASDSPSFALEVGRETAVLDLQRSRFNCDLDDAIFQLSFAPGTQVSDLAKHTFYTIGSKDQKTYLDRLAAEGRLGVEELARQEAHYHNTRAVTLPIWKTVLLYFALGVIAFLAVFLFWRITRLRRT